ncbi:MAG: hypothetical protein ACXWVB_01200 [Rhodoplanes sp.]
MAEGVAADRAIDVAQIEDQRHDIVVAGRIGGRVPDECVAGEGDDGMRGIVGIADRLEKRAGVAVRIDEIVREREMRELGEIKSVAARSPGLNIEGAVGEGDVRILRMRRDDIGVGDKPQPVESHEIGCRDRGHIAGRPGQHSLGAASARAGDAGIGALDRQRLVDR